MTRAYVVVQRLQFGRELPVLLRELEARILKSFEVGGKS